MSTIYLLTPDSKLGKSGGRLVVRKGDTVISSQPLQAVEAVIVGAKAHISGRMLSFLSQSDCHVYFFDKAGNLTEHSASGSKKLSAKKSLPKPSRRKKTSLSAPESNSKYQAVGVAVAAITAGFLAGQLLRDSFSLPSAE